MTLAKRPLYSGSLVLSDCSFFRANTISTGHEGVRRVLDSKPDAMSVTAPNYHACFQPADSLDRFFAKKKYFCGGPIPHGVLHNERNYRLVRSFTVEYAFDYIYTKLMPRMSKRPSTSSLPWDVDYAHRLFSETREMGIPVLHRPGLLMVHFELCEGFDLPFLNKLKEPASTSAAA